MSMFFVFWFPVGQKCSLLYSPFLNHVFSIFYIWFFYIHISILVFTPIIISVDTNIINVKSLSVYRHTMFYQIDNLTDMLRFIDQFFLNQFLKAWNWWKCCTRERSCAGQLITNLYKCIPLPSGELFASLLSFDV